MAEWLRCSVISGMTLVRIPLSILAYGPVFRSWESQLLIDVQVVRNLMFGQEHLPDLWTLSFVLFLSTFPIHNKWPWWQKRYFDVNFPRFWWLRVFSEAQDPLHQIVKAAPGRQVILDVRLSTSWAVSSNVSPTSILLKKWAKQIGNTLN